MMFKNFTRRLISALTVVFFAAAMAGTTVEALNEDPSEEAWEALRQAAKDRPRHIIYDNDGDDAAAFPNELTPGIENILALRTSFLKDYPIDTISYSVTRGGFDHLDTRTDVGVRAVFTSPNYQNLTQWLHDQGTDSLQLQINYARANNIEIFAGIRVNDIHDSEDRPETPSPLYSAFKRAHPELIMNTDRNATHYGAWSAYNFSKSEVRERFYEVVAEMLEDYDVDGIAFDFNRDGLLMESVAKGEKITEQELEDMTSLFRQIRSCAERIGKSRGKPVLISVKVPDSAAYCKETGIDIEAWLEEGLVDLVVGGLHIEPWSEMAQLCHQNGAKFYASVEPELLNADNLVPTPVKRKNTAGYFAREAAAFAAGVDGIQYFNLFSLGSVQSIMRPDAEQIKDENKRYFPTVYCTSYQESWLEQGSKYSSKLPKVWVEEPILVLPGIQNELKLEFGDDLAALQAAGKKAELTAVIYGRIAQPQDLIARIGGYPLSYLSSVDDMHYFAVPYEALKPGTNEITLSMPEQGAAGVSVDTIMKGDQLLSGANQLPWRRMIESGLGSSETIVEGKYCITDGSAAGRPCLHYSLALPQTQQYSAQFPFVANFSCQVVSASDDHSVVFYVADGRYVTTVSLQPDEVKLLGTSASISMDTTDQMHQYQLKITDTEAILYADGADTPILQAPLTREIFSEDVKILGATYAIGGLDEHGVLFGSLSLAGTSQAYWKDIQIVRPQNSAWINDISVQLNFVQEETPHELLGGWQYQTTNDRMLPAGDWSYMLPQMAAEVELEVRSGAAEIIFSNGGVMLQQIITPSMTEFRQAGDQGGQIKNWPANSEHVRRFEVDQNGARSFNSLSTEAVGSGMSNVSMWLAGREASGYTQAERDLVRKGGILVKIHSGETIVKAIRTSIGANNVFKPGPEGITLLEDDCSDLTSSGWSVTAPATGIYIIDGKGHPENPGQVPLKPVEPGQYLAFCDENVSALSSLSKDIAIGPGDWTLTFDAKIKDLVTTSTGQIWYGFCVDVWAANRRYRISWTDQNKIMLMDAAGNPVAPVIELPWLPDNEFHTYTVYYDGTGNLSIIADSILLATYANAGFNQELPERITFWNNGGTWERGTNEVYMDNIGLYKYRKPDFELGPVGIALLEDDCSDMTNSGWSVTAPAAGIYIIDGKGHPENPGQVPLKPVEPGQYLAFCDENVSALSSLSKDIAIGPGDWTLTFDAKIKDLVTTSTGQIWYGFCVDVWAANRRYRISWTDQNKIMLMDAAGNPVASVIELPWLPDNEFHTYTIYYDGTGNLSIIADSILLATYANAGFNQELPERITFWNNGGTWERGTNEVYLDSIGLYKYRKPDFQTDATITMQDETVVYDGNQHSLNAATEPDGLELEITYVGIDGTIYPETTAGPVNAGRYTATAVVKTDGYTGTATAALTINKATLSVGTEVSVNPIEYGQTLGDAVLSGAFNGVHGEPLTGTFSWDEGNARQHWYGVDSGTIQGCAT